MNKKQEIREKVKEIKQRQQNWMKQRAESHGNSPGRETSSIAKSAGTQQKVTTKSQSASYHEKPSETDTQSLVKNLMSSNKSKAKFQNWLKAKESGGNIEVYDTPPRDMNHNSNLYNSDKYSDNLYNDQPYRDHKGSASVNVLRVPSTRSPEFATPDPSWNSDDETGEITAAQLLSPDDFDSRADDIIARVKGDLAQTNSDYKRNSHIDYTYETSVDKPAEQELSSHVCPTCEKLMMPPNASPMLLIPCGHTLCSTCSKKTKFCAICGCAVQSSTLNIMLQQIITNFHTKQTHRQTTRKSTVSSSVHRKNYQEEYQNLMTRQEILREESENISRNVQKLTRKLNQDKHQVASIQKKEEEIELEIEELQMKLKQLTEHKTEYEKNCYTHEIEVKQEKNRLVLVQDSLTSVEQQIEKVKLLAESGF
ncbi:uncharacterized protein LOC132758792 [Ruditapes philippinarum]|uniref:uncharacterized protein LOC132758792 n=1 Tax=Ruditapes philippinarum TaxID=129788 RepID=UPI00295BA750|nr:uncharacterized protein LOC132758792 [Ruditapes philippinarum]